MTGVRDYETGELKHNVVALARAAKVLRIPTVVTTTARESTSSIAPRSTRGTIRKSRPPWRRPDARS
jgi:hypothetical protein